MNYIKYLIGQGKPSIAIIGCLHGDEIAGEKVIKKLRKIRLSNGELGLFIANDKAFKKGKRFIKQDLNRSFAGRKDGNFEEKLAYELIKELKKFDIVIDLHATNSNIESLIVITKLNKKIKNLLNLVPIEKVAYINKKIFGGREMIRYCKIGISLEYGPDKSGKNYKKILKHIKIILSNLGVMGSERKLFPEKTLYYVSGIYPVSKKFEVDSNLRDFQFIKKGQIIGKSSGEHIKSNKSFYPIFLGKGRYENTFALMSSQRESLKV